MYVNCFPLHFCCLQLVTKAMLLYNSAICDLLRESIQIMKIPIHVKVVKWCRKECNEHNLMYIYRIQCEIMQKIQWNSWNGQLHFSALISLESVKVQGLSRHLSPETKAEHKESKRARQPRPGCWWFEASPRFWSGASRVVGWDAEVEVTLSKLRFRAISYPGNNIC